MNHALTLVEGPGETATGRAARLSQEARAAAIEATDQLLQSLSASRRVALEVVIGGDAYPTRIRSTAQRVSETLKQAIDQIDCAIRERNA